MAFSAALVLSPVLAQRPQQQAPAGPWMDKSLPPDQRADMVMAQMTLDEKISLVHGAGSFAGGRAGSNGGAGVIAGIPQVGFASDSVGGFRGGSQGGGRTRALFDAAAFGHRRSGHMGSEDGVCLWRRDRPGTARPAIQLLDWRRRGHHARAAQRPQFRVSGRGPGSGGQDGRATDSRRADPTMSSPISSTTPSTTRRRAATLATCC